MREGLSEAPEGGKAVIPFSSGPDSTAMLWEAADRHEELFPVYMKDGLGVNEVEIEAARNILSIAKAQWMGTCDIHDLEVVDYSPVYDHLGYELPEGEDYFGRDGADLDPLPMRVLHILTMAGGVAEREKADYVYYGIVNDDGLAPGTWDLDVYEGAELGIQSTNPRKDVEIVLPFVDMLKSEAIEYADKKYEVPWENTRSCFDEEFDEDDYAVKVRKKAFEEAGVHDPRTME